MPKRIWIKTSLVTLLCISCQPSQAQSTGAKKKVAMIGTGNVAAPRVVPATSVPVRGLGGRPTGINSIQSVAVKRAYPSTHLQKGLYLKQQGKTDDALLEFILSAQEDPSKVRAFYEQAEIFKQKGKPALARSALEQALAIAPSYNDARTALVQMHVSSGNLMGAASEVGKMLGLGNNKPGPATNKALSSEPDAHSRTKFGIAAAQPLVSRAGANDGARNHRDKELPEADPAQAIASWLSPEKKNLPSQERNIELEDAATGSITGTKPGSYEAVAASLGILPIGSPPAAKPPSEAVSPASPGILPSSPASTAKPSEPVLIPKNNGTVEDILASVPTAQPLSSTSPAIQAAAQAALKGMGTKSSARNGFLDRTLDKIKHPTMPALFHRANASSAADATPTSSAGADAHPPVASWVKSLGTSFRKRAKQQPENSAIAAALASGNTGAVTVTHIDTPAEIEANASNGGTKSKKPTELSPELQKMLASIVSPGTAPNTTVSQSAAPPVTPTASNVSPLSSVKTAVVSPVAPAASQTESKNSTTTASGGPLFSTTPIAEDTSKHGYSLLKNNASARMPDLTLQAVEAKAARPPERHEPGLFENIWKKATAMMPPLPNFTLPAWLGGKANAAPIPPPPPSTVVTAAAPQIISTAPPAAAVSKPPADTPNAAKMPPDVTALPAAVAEVLNHLDGEPVASAPATGADKPAPLNDATNAQPSMPPAVLAVVQGLSTPGGDVPQAPSAPATPKSAATEEPLPVVVDSILNSVENLPPTAKTSSGADVVNAPSLDSVNAIVAAASPLPPAASAAPPEAPPSSPANVAAVLAAVPGGATAPAVASTSVAAMVPPMHTPKVLPKNTTPPASGVLPGAIPVPRPQAQAVPVGLDIQKVLGKISSALPQPSALASFFHLRKSTPHAVPATPEKLTLANAVIPPMPAAVDHKSAVPAPHLQPSKAVIPTVAALPTGQRRDVPEALPSVVKDILNKVDNKFYPSLQTQQLPSTYVPAPVALDRSNAEAPQVQPLQRSIPTVIAVGPAPQAVGPSFDNVPTPEVRPAAPTPVPVAVQSVLSKIPVTPGAPLTVASSRAALPLPSAFHLNNAVAPQSLPAAGNPAPSRSNVQLPQLGLSKSKNNQVYAKPPEQTAAAPQNGGLPVMVRQFMKNAENILPKWTDAPSTMPQSGVPEPVNIPKSDVQVPAPITPSRTIDAPQAAPVPTGADLSKYFTDIVPEVRQQAQEQAPLPEARSASTQRVAPQMQTQTPSKSLQNAGKLNVSSRQGRTGAFTYMQPVFDSDKTLIGASQLRSIPAATAKTEQPKAPPPPPEDPVTKRMRYLLQHGTANLKPGEAFMYSEETGEGILFLPGQEAQRRKLTAPKDHDAVLEERRPDIIEPKDVQYTLNLLGKLLPPQQSGDQHPIQGPSIDQLMNQANKGIWGWMKDTFKMK